MKMQGNTRVLESEDDLGHLVEMNYSVRRSLEKYKATTAIHEKRHAFAELEHELMIRSYALSEDLRNQLLG